VTDVLAIAAITTLGGSFFAFLGWLAWLALRGPR
jgi:hypothetical protein